MLWTMVLASNVWAATYNYTGAIYTNITNHTTSTLGLVGNYLNTMKVTGTLTTAAPLAANLAGANISAQITGYTFFDGFTTFASSDANIRLADNFVVSSNAFGQIIGMDAAIERWQAGAAPHVVNDRLDYLLFSGAAVDGIHNLKCNGVGVSPAGIADACTSPTLDSNSSEAFVVSGGVWSEPVAGTVSTVPTLSEWGVIILSLSIVVFGMIQSWRRSCS